MTGAVDATDTRLLWCYGVLGLDVPQLFTNVRLVDGGSGGAGAGQFWVAFTVLCLLHATALPYRAVAACCCIVIGLQRLVLLRQR